MAESTAAADFAGRMIEPPPPAGKKESHKASQRAAPSRKKRAKCLLVSAAATTATPSGASLRMRTLKSGLDSIMDCTEFKVGCTAGGLLCTHQADDGNDYGDPYYGLYCPRSQDLLQQVVIERVPDIIIFSQTLLHRHLMETAKKACARIVLDLHNVESELTRVITSRWPDILYYPQDHRQVARAEAAAARAADQIWCCSAEDVRLMERLYRVSPPAGSAAVPNCFEPKPGSPAASVATGSLIFTGRLDYAPNVCAAVELGYDIFPLIQAAHPGASLVVAGASPSPGVRELARRPGVEVIAGPTDVPALLAGRVLAVPLRVGGGTRIKILEAFSVGSPVIATATATEGIAAAPGTHFLRAETPEDFAEAFSALIGDPALYSRLSHNARELVRRRYSHTALQTALGRACETLLSLPDPRAQNRTRTRPDAPGAVRALRGIF